MVRRLRRYLALSATDRWTVLRAFVHLTVVDLALRLDGLGPSSRLRVPAASTTVVTRDDVRRARRDAHLIELAARYHVLRPRCLHRSLVLHRWLREANLPSELRIGVRKDNGALKAHAWVVLGEHVVGDPREAVASFTPLHGRPVGAVWM